MILRMAIRAGEVAAPPAPKFGLAATGKAPARMTETRVARPGGGCRPRGADAQGGAGGARRVLGERDRRPRRRGRARVCRAAARGGRRAARSRLRRTALNPDQRAAADDLAQRVADRAFSASSARGRHRIGQDRGLFRGGRRSAAAGPPGAGADAGDRADRAIPRPVRGAFRRAAGRMAFGLTERQRERVWARRRAARRGSSSARARRCSCRSPTSASSSSTRSTTAPTSRRTASSITRATWRSCAARLEQARGRARLRHAGARDAGQRRERALSLARGCRRGSARRRCPTSPRST